MQTEMRTLPLPPQAAPALLATCIGGVHDADLALRLNAISHQLNATAAVYDQLARVQSLYQVPRTQGVGNVACNELQSLYSGQMSAANGAARAVYDAIRNASPNSKCPLCGVGTIRVLDHHLPKSRYPDLSVCPFNLVPACDFCNVAKHARFPLTAGEQTIHPYYDDYTQEQWVFATLDTAGPAVLIYYVDAPVQWADVARDRVAHHFAVVKLGETYTSNANDDLITLRSHLVSIAATKGQPGVLANLVEEQNRYAGRLNSWQHCMYQALANDAVFVGGGYLAIPH